MFDQNFLLRKIKLIQEDLARLESFGKYSLAELTQDDKTYAATERVLERIVTRAIDVNRHILAELGNGAEKVKTYEETFLALAKLKIYPEDFAKQIAPSAGLRNILVHEYDEVNIETIYKSTVDALEQYAKYCGYLLKFLSKQ